MHKINRQNAENKFFAKNAFVEKYTEGYQCAKSERFILIHEAMIAKKWVWPTYCCKVGQINPVAI